MDPAAASPTMEPYTPSLVDESMTDVMQAMEAEAEKQRSQHHAETTNESSDFDPTLEEFSREDYDFKVKALTSSFSPDMLEIVHEFRREQAAEEQREAKQREAAKRARRSTRILNREEMLAKKEEKRLENEALMKGVSMQALRELKVAFEKKKASDGSDGVDEDEFLRLFGPTLCRGKSEEETRHWFRAIDQNCSGSIQWDEVSNYLVNYHVYAERMKTKIEDYFVAKPIEPKGLVSTRRHHRLPIHRLLFSHALDTFYTASNDGCVLAWSPNTLKATHVVHKSSEGLWVYDFAFLASSNRLIVLQSDRCFFMYDCFVSQNELRHELFRVFATKGVTTKTFKDGSSYYECIDRHQVTGENVHTIDHTVVQERVTPNMRPATLLAPSKVPIRCFDHVSGFSSGIGAGEPIVCGLDDGSLECYTLQPIAAAPIKPYLHVKSHGATVTRVKYAAELNGVISCALDGTIVVTDLDIRQIVQRLVVQNPIQAHKPQFDFEYKTFHNMLLSWTSRTLHVWNALTGARLTNLPDHDAPIVHASINIDRMIAYVLLENKKIRVWDLRNWKPMGEFVDETPRYCNDTLNFMYWCPKHHYLVSGCSELFALRPRDVQERIDAGLVPSNKNYVGHLHPIRDARPIDFADHIVAIDSHDVGVWGLQTKKLLAMWKWRDADDNVTSFAVAPDTVRIAVGTESGVIEMYNYACGFRIFTLLHDDMHKNAAVSAVVFLAGAKNDGPPTCCASVGPAIHAWITPRENEDDVEPELSYRHPDPNAVAWHMVCIDANRQILAAAFNNGEVQIMSALSMSCMCSLAFRSPPDRLMSFPGVPCLLAAAHADGTLRFAVYDASLAQLHPLFGFQGAFVAEESITCMAQWDERLVVGDSVGTISIFSLGPLLQKDFVRAELMTRLADLPSLYSKIRSEIVTALELEVAFDAHESSVTSVNVIHGKTLVTSGGDRLLRNWDLDSLSLTHEYGNEKSINMFQSFTLTPQHMFHASSVLVGSELEKRGLGRVSRALSFAKRGSILAQELRRIRLVQDEKRRKQVDGALEEDDDAFGGVPEDTESQLVADPSFLIQHRRKMSALVGDFVLRDDPKANLAVQLEVTGGQRKGSLDAAVQTKSLDAHNSSSPLHHKGKKSRASGARSEALAVERRVSEHRVSLLRACRTSIMWETELDTPDPNATAASLGKPTTFAVPISSPATSPPPSSTDVKGATRPALLLPPIQANSSSAIGSPTNGNNRLLGVHEISSSASFDESPVMALRRPVAKKYGGPVSLPSLNSSTTSLPQGGRSSGSSTPLVSPENASKRRRNGPQSSRAPSVDSGPLDEVQLFKIATDHVLKHQTGLVRTVPVKGVQSKLQEVMRIKQERQDEMVTQSNNQASAGIFYRLTTSSVDLDSIPVPNMSKASALDIMMASTSGGTS